MSKVTKYTYYEAYEKFKEKGYTIIDDKEFYENSKTKVNCIDNLGYKYYIDLETIINYTTIDKMSKYNPYTIDNINYYIRLNKIETKLVSTEYVNTDSKLEFECKCGERFFVSLHHFMGMNQQYCKKCRRHVKVSHEDLEKHFLSYGLTPNFDNLIRRPTKTTKIKCINQDGYIGETTWNRVMLHNGAFDIISRKNKYTLQNMNTYFKNNKIKVRVEENQTYNGSKDRLTFYCGDCGEQFISTWNSVYNNNLFLCDSCRQKTSSLEHKTLNYLNDNNVCFIPQYRFDDCKNKRSLPFDFYLPNKNICIECNGMQHYEEIEYFGGKEGFERRVKNDGIKEIYCEEKGLKLIKLPYSSFDGDEYISILDNEIFNIKK